MSKLQSIDKLNHVKNFSDFTTPEPLQKKNVLYAPTGVGKTNLSRFLRAISDEDYDLRALKAKEAEDAAVIDFEVVLQDGRVLTRDNYANEDFGPIAVYNSDFVERNVRSQNMADDNISGTLEVELGDEHNKLKNLEEKRDVKAEKLRDAESELQSDLEVRRDSIRSRDPRGKNILKELTYNKVEEETYRDYLKEKEEWEDAWEHLEELQDTDAADDKIKYQLTPINYDDVDFAWLKEELEGSRTFPEPPVGDVKDHLQRVTSKWIEDGLKYHEDDEEGKCPFCRRSENQEFEEMLRKYRDYVASEEVQYKRTCREEKRHLETLKEELRPIEHIDLKAVVESTAGSLGEDVTWSVCDVSNLLSNIGELIGYVEEKIERPGEPVSRMDVDDASAGEGDQNPADIIEKGLEVLNEDIRSNATVVETLNARMEDLSRRKAELRTLIGKRELVEFYTTHKQGIEKRDELKKELKQLEREVEKAKGRLPGIDASEKVVQLFNRFIRRMGIDKYRAEVKEEEDGTKRIILHLNDDYEMSRDVNEVLSEGEKDAVSLSYFLASLILRLNSLDAFANAVIVVDDPVNSLNYRYFYGVCSVVKTFTNDIKEVLGGDENNENPQLFVLTHNMQFYNMVLKNVFRDSASYYQLEEVNGKHKLRSLTDGEKLSSFHTAMRRIKGYAEESHSENIGNDIRRVLETLCSFHGHKLDRNSVKKLFADQEVKEALLMFAHDQSHADLDDVADSFDGEMYKELARHLLELMSGRYKKIIADLPAY